MEKKIQPNPSIINALNSASENATPFSRIPGFIKKYAITNNQKEELVSILSSIGKKEVTYINTRLEKIQNNKNGFNPEFYNTIKQIESGTDSENKSINDKLIGLAKEIIASEMGSPVYQILKQTDADLGTGIIDPSIFNNLHQYNLTQFSDDDKKHIEQEQQARIIINALIMGAGHRIFDKIETDKKYSKAINKISPNLYNDYYDMVYTNLKHMRESEHINGYGMNTGSMQLINEDNQTKIKIKADIFPVLLHEMAKGVIEYLAYTRYNNMNPEIIESILSVDSRESEHWMMLVGPQIYKQLFFLIKESIAQYNDEIGLVEGKKESDYILPIISQILQSPADKFLFFMESILREDQDGNESIGLIKKIIDSIHNQYEGYLLSNKAPKTQLTIEEIMKQLVRELDLSKKEAYFTKTSLGDVQETLQREGYMISNKKLARKLAEYYKENKKKFDLSDTPGVSDWIELNDAIHGLRKTRIEQAAFSSIHEQQKKFPKRTKTHEGRSINIHPRFPLSTLEEAKKNINSEVLEEINNKIIDFIQKGSISEWINDHHEMSTILANLTERFITLDSTIPECLMQREDNRGLYELTNLEQLKRESGSMGGHCVANFIDSVQDGSLKVFSLRKGTKSHWTIGYQPKEQTIIQVKGYTNQQKNSVLMLEDPDYVQVIQALNYLCANMNVRKINDVDILSKQGFLLTNKGFFSPKELEEKIQESDMYEIVSLKENSKVILSDVKTLEKINLKNIGIIEFIKGGLTIQYHTSTKTIETNRTSEVTESFSSEIGTIIEKLSSIKIHDFFTKYDDYPVFRSKTRAFVQKEGKYGFVERTESGFKEVLSCEYETLPQDLGKDKYGIKQNGRYGIIKEHNGTFKKVLGCEYDDLPRLQYESSLDNQYLYLVKKNGKCGIIRENEDDTRTNLLPCEYDELPRDGVEGLRENECIMTKNKKHGIIRKNEDDTWTEVLACEYEKISFFGQDGLPQNQTRAQKNKKYGIIERTDLGYKEILNFEYDNKPEFGNDILQENEIILAENSQYLVIRTLPDFYSGSSYNQAKIKKVGKDYIRKKNIQNEWEESEYKTYKEITLGIGGLEDHALAKNNNGKFSIVKNNGDNTRTEVLLSAYDGILGFGEKGVKINQARAKKNGQFGIIEINTNNTLTELVNFEYDTIPEFGKYGLDSNQARAKKDGKYGIIQKDTNNIFIEILDCKYDKIPVLSEVSSTKRTIVTASRKEGMIEKNTAGIRTEIIPCEYTSIEFSKRGVGPNQAIVGKDGKQGIINISEEGIVSEVLSSIYDKIIDIKENKIIVEKDNKSLAMKKNQEGIRTKFFLYNYDEILQFGTGGLGEDEAIVRHNGKLEIIRRNETGNNEIIESQYRIKNLGKLGLQEKEAIAKKEGGGMGIIRREIDGSIRELLPCKYDAVGLPGKDGLTADEAIVVLNGKQGIIQRTENGFIEVLPCEYYIINTFDEEGLARSQKEKDGEYTLLKKMENGNISPIFDSYKMCEFHFGEGGLLPNESFLEFEKHYYSGIVRINENGFLETLLEADYQFEEGYKMEGLLKNEYKVFHNEYGEQIVSRDSDGTRKEISLGYNTIGSIGERKETNNFENIYNENEAFVSDDYGNEGIIKRTKSGFIEILACKYQCPDFIEDQNPIVFYPYLIDGKRVIVARNNDYGKELLIENDTGIFEEIIDMEAFFEHHQELKKFFAETLRFYYEKEYEDQSQEDDENNDENNDEEVIENLEEKRTEEINNDEIIYSRRQEDEIEGNRNNEEDDLPF